MDKIRVGIRRGMCLCLMIALVLCLIGVSSVAEEIKLRGWNEEEGYQYVQFGWYPYETDGADQPILWRILSVSGKTAYVQSVEAIDAYKGTRYTTLTQMFEVLRKFLFTRAERDALMSSAVLSLSDLRNPNYGFITEKSNCDERCLEGTPYAMSKGLAAEIPNVCYWTGSGRESYYVNPAGAILPVSRPMTLGVAPVLRFNFNVLKLDGGSGTEDDPFTSSMSERCMALENTQLNLNLGDMILLNNPARKAIPVYSGPGREYFQFEGSFITKHNVKILPVAHDGDWLMIEYTAGGTYDLYPTDSASHKFARRKIGYISLSDAPGTISKSKLKWDVPQLPTTMYKGVIGETCSMYDSIDMMGDPIYSLSEGTPIRYIGYELIAGDPVAYIEADVYDTLVRGFVTLDAVEVEDYDMELLRQIF